MSAPKGNKNALGNKGGRPTKYQKSFATQARKLCLLGSTNQQLADFFEVSISSIEEWGRENIEFSRALVAGREQADANVADRLYNRAMGYKHKAVKIFNDSGSPLIVPYVEHYPPDTAAATFWLKNRNKEKWRDRQEVTGADGGPVLIITGVDRDDGAA